MKKNKLNCFLLLLLACLSLQSCILLQAEEETTTAPLKPPIIMEPSQIETVLQCYQNTVYVYRADIDQSVLTTELQARYLLLMNKEKSLGAEYVPASLSPVTCPTHYDEKLEMESRAAEALVQMYREMQADGINVDDLMVTSAYRSYEYQRLTYNAHLRKEMEGISVEAINCLGEEYIRATYWDRNKSTLSETDAHKVVQSYSAKPGQSEHQTGLCVDFITSGMDDKLTVQFEESEAFAWLSENAYRFGFILRYPEGKEEITGYTYEPWHYRFVGREAATNMYFADLTLEEYLAICKV